jgi:hypothetical protein
MHTPRHRKGKRLDRIIHYGMIVNTIAAVVIIAFISQTIYAAMLQQVAS